MPEPTTPAELLVDFANTYEVDGDLDVIGTPETLRDWLSGRGLLPATGRATRADLDLAHTLRDGLRTAMAVHHDDETEPVRELDAAASRFTLRVAFDMPEPRVVPTGDGVVRALGLVLVAVQESVADGTWHRLKLCRSDTCQWAFFDGSKNQCRSWCSMAVCGNREKTKAYRARQRPRG